MANVVRLVIPKESDAITEQQRSTGKRSGLGVHSFIGVLFEGNEKLSKKNKMTDVMIQNQIIAEFSGRKVASTLLDGTRTVNYYRNQYNSGRLLGKMPPSISYRYNDDGEVVNGRTGKLMVKKAVKR
jgi:hypothetical protein